MKYDINHLHTKSDMYSVNLSSYTQTMLEVHTPKVLKQLSYTSYTKKPTTKYGAVVS